MDQLRSPEPQTLLHFNQPYFRMVHQVVGGPSHFHVPTKNPPIRRIFFSNRNQNLQRSGHPNHGYHPPHQHSAMAPLSLEDLETSPIQIQMRMGSNLVDSHGVAQYKCHPQLLLSPQPITQHPVGKLPGPLVQMHKVLIAILRLKTLTGLKIQSLSRPRTPLNKTKNHGPRARKGSGFSC